ncbi:hypothetical protein M1446_04660 [Candidatus Dependentiae bacterium]|nr:hypothetical protein [Candidatus Dependentiae bacterium]
MNISNNMYYRLNAVYNLLKYTYGLILIIVGSDKFLNMVTFWQKYISPFASEVLPVEQNTFLMLFGAAEILTGLLILSKYTRIGCYITIGVLAIIIINLLSMGMYYDIATRDLLIAIGIYALAEIDVIVKNIQK